MCKSKLFKSLICGAVMALTIGTGVFAGTVEREEYVLNEETYSDSYSGTVGNYTVTGMESYTVLELRNNGGSPKLYYGTVRAYNHASEAYENDTTKAYTISPGSYERKYMDRDMREAKYSYEHIAEGFYSTTSSVRLDYYKFTAQQWDG